MTDLRGEIQYAERLAEACQGAAVEAVVFTGNIVSAGARVAEWVAAHRKGIAPDYSKSEVHGHPERAARLFGAALREARGI